MNQETISPKPHSGHTTIRSRQGVATIVVLLIALVVHLLEQIPESTLRSTNQLIFHPDMYHGESKTHDFFEGWYYKLVGPGDDGEPISMAIVPGVFMGNTVNSSETHAFIFITVNGEKQHYYKFDLTTEFQFSKPNDGKYFIRIGNNTFTHKGISMNLVPDKQEDASLTIVGNVEFGPLNPWPVSFFHLGCMGPVGWLRSILECSHGVVSLDHTLHGSLNMNGESVALDGGRGYTEKDYGSNFPSLWVWIQTNSFPKNPGTSLFFSVARIPMPFGFQFPGFTAAVWHKNQLIPFATYTGAKFSALRIDPEEVYIQVKDSFRGYTLEVTVDRRAPHVMLYAPYNFTRMEPFVNEALHAKVHMRLTKRVGSGMGFWKNADEKQEEVVLIDDTGHHAGLEVHQNVEWLVENMCGKPNANKFLCL